TFSKECRARSQTDVAHTSQIEARTDRRAVDRSDYGNVQLIQRERDPLNTVTIGVAQLIRRTGEDTRAVAHVLHVATGAECTAITGQHHYPRGAVAAQLGTEIDELLDLLGGCQC